MSRLIIIGAGGHGKVVADATNKKCIFLDDNQDLEQVVGSIEQLQQIQQDDDQVIVAIGDNKTRLSLLDGLCSVATVVHPSATVSESASLGKGTVVFANVVLNPETIIGRGCVINTGATVDHDCVLEDGVHISPGANIGGGVTIGCCSWIGIGASVRHGTTIGKNVVVGAGAAVVSDIPDGITVAGVPAKELS
jgi:sugar O-acyltransferase (sialic acid O-acetyltransferase NeuD family)